MMFRDVLNNLGCEIKEILRSISCYLESQNTSCKRRSKCSCPIYNYLVFIMSCISNHHCLLMKGVKLIGRFKCHCLYVMQSPPEDKLYSTAMHL